MSQSGVGREKVGTSQIRAEFPSETLSRRLPDGWKLTLLTLPS